MNLWQISPYAAVHHETFMPQRVRPCIFHGVVLDNNHTWQAVISVDEDGRFETVPLRELKRAVS